MKKQINLFGDICRVITESAHPRKTLDTMVHMIAARLGIDVCSVYLMDASETRLVLRATVGLSQDAVDTVHMDVSEGLTGLVMETMAPVFARNPSTHPRYKHFDGTREEKYRTFLGLPLVYHQKRLGVMVVQTVGGDGIQEGDIPVFTALSSQVAATAAYTGLLENVKKGEGAGPIPGKTKGSGKKNLLQGVPVSSGFAEGAAHFLGKRVGFDQVPHETAEDIPTEIARIESAFEKSEAELQSLMGQVRDLSTQDQAILDTHLMMLQDNAFKKKVKDHIQEGLTAAYALKKIVLKHVDFFRGLDDPYLQDRGADIEDIGKRVLRNLFGFQGAITTALERPTILVASDISPVDVVALKQANLKGILLSKGGKTSHAVILARSFEIPMVIGVSAALDTIKPEDPLILDGNSGLVFRKPTREIIQEYAHLKAEKAKQHQVLSALKPLASETLDGHGVRLGANIGLVSDVDLAEKYGADHIGLYRTEFPFLVYEDFPSEAVQLSLYKQVIDAARGRSVTIRTLDVGGDKFLSYLDYPKEKNPYLGWRSVRVLLELDTVFRTQMRAIMRAAAFGKVKLLFPMISSVTEIRKIRAMIEEEKQALEKTGHAFDPGIEIGIMVEVPAAVTILDRLLRYADFASIGSNDLIQYALAVDRSNEKVAALYDPLHPAVISMIYDAVTTCRQMNKPVSICGEAASNPLCAFLFLGMKVDRLSMNPASLLIVKNLIRKTTFKDAREALERVLVMEDSGEIIAFLKQYHLPEASGDD
ncbi:MAG: phosphoenolpyruvate--protein phosphotransferase [Desulfobacterium sp.]|nr:phosphoenolpyruvate--protein phosphotransferase [Desulfobacterium sp.]